MCVISKVTYGTLLKTMGMGVVDLSVPSTGTVVVK